MISWFNFLSGPIYDAALLFEIKRQTDCFQTEAERYAYIIGAQSATLPNVRRAYKKLALKTHPDKFPGSEYHEEFFKVLAEVYQRAEDAIKYNR